ncbi:MAG TPA: amino acid transporter, partial [Vicinamibacteria bacterium]|nr:amino acid transporter [Vicinamibacteria bacterium]
MSEEPARPLRASATEDVPRPAPAGARRPARSPFVQWLFFGLSTEGGPHQHPTYPWWRVMCLTGVDYFSTLGYQPGIAFLAAGFLSPLATFVLVLVTLLVALPIYGQVASHSPHGQGSILMLEQLLPRWKGKAFVLVLLGFAFTDFIITITLSAADAAAHLVENPFVPAIFHHQIRVTLVLLALLAAVFLKGFKEAIGFAVLIVAFYLLLNTVLLTAMVGEVLRHPESVAHWREALFLSHRSVPRMIALSLLLFPKLALGLSGFETGVAVMPLVRGDAHDDPARPRGRIRNTRKLLVTAALLMSVFLMASSFVTTVLIPRAEFAEGGQASGRALAYLAHKFLGQGFGTVYDLATIGILWFAGASAMAGLLNLVPRYLPPYGMAPDWARATRPLVLVFTAVTVLVTLLFHANVEAQGGAYATGVLFLMTSASIAVTLAYRGTRRRWTYGAMAVVFAYTTVTNVVERPEGLKIASLFILAIVVASGISRTVRSLEIRLRTVRLDAAAQAHIDEVAARGIRIIAHRPDKRTEEEYDRKEAQAREDHSLDQQEPVIFLEVSQGDASEYTGDLM